MYPRIVERKNKDGSVREYLYLVESQRINGKVVQKNIASLGRLPELKEKGKIDSLITHLEKFSEKIELLNLETDLEGESSKELGRVLLYRKIWEKLGFSKTLNKYFQDKKTSYDIGEVILSMVVNRLTAPSSKREIINWKEEIYEPKWDKMELQHVYRAMDYLIEQKEEFETELLEKTIDLFNQKLDVIMFDTTSIVHWGDGEHSDLLKHGHSKDKRPDSKTSRTGPRERQTRPRQPYRRK